MNRVRSRDSKGPGTMWGGGGGGCHRPPDAPPSALLVLPSLPLTARVFHGRPEPPPLPTGLSTPARLSSSRCLLRRLPQPPSRPPFSSTAPARLLGRAGGEEEQPRSLRGSACDTWSAREGRLSGCGGEQKLAGGTLSRPVGRPADPLLPGCSFSGERDSAVRFLAPFLDVVVFSCGFVS